MHFFCDWFPFHDTVEKEVGKKGTETGEEVEQEDDDNAEATDESKDEMEV